MDIFFFVNFDSLGGNFLLANTSHVLSKTQRHKDIHQTTKNITSFVPSISAKKPFYIFFFTEKILPPSVIMKSVHVF